MLRYLALRIPAMVAVFFAVSIGLFGLVHAAPGDPVSAMVSPEQQQDATAFLEKKRHELGLDQPLPQQYLSWMGRVLRGDLGDSFVQRRSVSDLMVERLVPTLELTLTGMIGGVVLALIFGIWAASRKNTATDYTIGTLSLLLISVPAFFIGMLAIYIFSVKLGALPSTGMETPGDGSLPDRLKHLLMPGGILAIASAAGLTRYVRAGMLEEMSQDYVRTALAKGASPTRAKLHALRNSLLPLITIVMMNAPELLGGAVILETIFSWPGMGQLTIKGIQDQDYPLIIGFGMVVTVLVLLANLLADVLYRLADPRVRLS